jgi:hypothetical protein
MARLRLMDLERTKSIREGRTRLIDLALVDFVPALTPRYDRPEHLWPIADFFDRVNRGEVVKMLVSASPQMGKSETIEHGVAQYLARTPERPIIYASYGASIAEEKSRLARDYARACGVELRDDASAVGTWLTPEGGGVRARGIGGPTTGNPAKLFVVDDPHKDRQEAESALLRQKVYDWYTSVADTRTHPDSSILVAHTRWDEDDLIGRLKELRHPTTGAALFEYYNLPAILPDGRPLWEKRPLEWLEPKKLHEHDWWSLWMGAPRRKGNRLFKAVAYYDKLPDHYRIGKGLDLAYTTRTSSCFSVGLVLLEDTDSPSDKPVFYVVDVRRAQKELRQFAREDLAPCPWPGLWHWFRSTTEQGVADLLPSYDVGVEAVLATADKFARAQGIAAAWNDRRVLLPRQAPWLRDLVDEVGSFTGVGDKSDDQVDSLASAFESLRAARGPNIAKTVAGAGGRFGGVRGFG